MEFRRVLFRSVYCIIRSLLSIRGRQESGLIARLGETRPSPFRSREERDLERIEKREAVLKAAVEMFNARGFHATSLDDLAASLGISKPPIYHSLGNKDQVLLECLTRGLLQRPETP